MKRPGLQFRSLHVRRMPGFESGGFRLTDLCDGINIIFGPNASGKTTAARSLSVLLWPSMSPATTASLTGEFDLENQRWLFDLDGGILRCECPGSIATPPVLPPADYSLRYVLSLQDLMAADREPFAAEIHREMVGGYSLPDAAAGLGLRSASYASSKAEVKALAAAEYAVREAESEQQKLLDEERRTQELQEALGQAEAISAQLQALEKGLENAQMGESLNTVLARIEGFPSALAMLNGDELERMEEWESELETQADECRLTESEIGRLDEQIDATGLRGRDFSREALSYLKKTREQLAERTRHISQYEDSLAGARREVSALLNGVESSAAVANPAEQRLPSTKYLSEFLNRAAGLQAETASLQTLDSALGEIEDPGDLQACRSGIALLQKWLRSSGSRPGKEVILLLLATVLSAATAVFLFLMGALWWGIAAAVSSLIVAGWLFHQWGSNRRKAIEEQYAKLSLSRPRSWDGFQVEAQLDELNQQLAAGLQQEQRRRFRESRADQRAELAAKRRQFEEDHRRLCDELGVMPTLDELSLAWVFERLRTYQSRLDRIQQYEGELKAARKAVEELLGRLNGEFKRLSLRPAANALEAETRIEVLENRWSQFEAASAQITLKRRLLKESLHPRIENLRAKRTELLSRLGLQPGEEHRLRSWLAELDEYRRLVAERDSLQGQRRYLEQLVSRDSGLLELSCEALQTRVDRSKAAAGEVRSLEKEISTIEGRLSAARRAHNLEDALARRDQAREALRTVREEDYDSALGTLLVDRLQSETYGKNLPPVLQKARRLFSRITKGRFELQVENSSQPQFHVRDTRSGRGRSLDELSSATRLQLLVAVRIAFVESREQGFMLPLILDETLANSDDERARLLIETVVEITKQGRQVFYFTAQEDEVAKWRAVLAEAGSDMPYSLIDLLGSRRVSEAEQRPFDFPPEKRKEEIPPPEGLTRQEYAQRLRVPGLDALQDSVASVHLWYLIEDLSLLYRLLESGVSNWGQLDSLLEHGTLQLMADVQEFELRKAQSAARALDAILKARRIGRGKRVDRSVILRSAILTSETVIEKTAALAESVEGDAARLLEELRNGGVERFRKASLPRLEAFLESEGYLDSRPRLSDSEVLSRAADAVRRDLEQGLISLEQVRQLVSLVP